MEREAPLVLPRDGLWKFSWDGTLLGKIVVDVRPHIDFYIFGRGIIKQTYQVKSRFECGSVGLPGLALDKLGNLFISCTDIRSYSRDGTFLRKFPLYCPNQLDRSPLSGSICCDPTGSLLIVACGDSSNHNWVHVYDIETGQLKTKWGNSGTKEGEFDCINGITTDHEGNVYCSDSYNDRIQVFTSSGTFIRAFGGSGLGKLNRPFEIAVDYDGHISVADINNQRIQVFTQMGEPIGDIFSHALALCVDRLGNLVLAHSYCDEQEIYICTKKGEFVAKVTGESLALGETFSPSNVVLDNDGNLIVLNEGTILILG